MKTLDNLWNKGKGIILPLTFLGASLFLGSCGNERIEEKVLENKIDTTQIKWNKEKEYSCKESDSARVEEMPLYNKEWANSPKSKKGCIITGIIKQEMKCSTLGHTTYKLYTGKQILKMQTRSLDPFNVGDSVRVKANYDASLNNVLNNNWRVTGNSGKYVFKDFDAGFSIREYEILKKSNNL